MIRGPAPVIRDPAPGRPAPPFFPPARLPAAERSAAGTGRDAPSPARAWVLAARPKTLFAAVGPVLLGAGLAGADGAFAPAPFAAALACALLIQIAANFANDYSDYVRGVDTEERTGFTRTAQAGWVRPRQLVAAVAAAFAMATLISVYLVLRGGWPVVAIGVAAMVATVTYTGGPWPFGYHGLGDLFAFVFFGPVAVGGTYYVQALSLPADALLAGAGVGALVTAILVVNNLRDLDTDARAGKRTLAVLLGRRGTKAEYVGLLGLAAAVPPAGVVLAAWSPGALTALAAFSLAPRAVRTVLDPPAPRALNPVLARTALLSAVYAALFAAGVAL